MEREREREREKEKKFFFFVSFFSRNPAAQPINDGQKKENQKANGIDVFYETFSPSKTQ